MAAAPLRDSRSATIGALVLGWDTAVSFDAFLEAMVNTIADLVAQALERAALHASEHELVAALRLSVVGAVDAPPGAKVATRYLPASATVGIGGDWFDVIVTDDERFVVAIGDVSGHGVSAVAAMAEARALINGLIRQRERLDRVFGSFARMRGGDALLLSVLLLEFDLAARTVTYASAGHPWPMVRRADGSLSVLDQAQQPLLGAAPAVERAATTPFDLGDVLVAFTDGLIERRGEDISVGIDRIASALADSSTPIDADRVADALLAAVDLQGQTGAVDDAAVVIVACG
jgi:serine phosphatase RsbU (regulator of sigma subunit)